MENVSSSSALSPSAFVSSCSLFSSLPLLQEQSIFPLHSKIAMVLELRFYTLPFSSLIFFPFTPHLPLAAQARLGRSSDTEALCHTGFYLIAEREEEEGSSHVKIFSSILAKHFAMSWDSRERKLLWGVEGHGSELGPHQRDLFASAEAVSKVATSAQRLFLPIGPLFAHSVFT